MAFQEEDIIEQQAVKNFDVEISRSRYSKRIVH